MAQEIFGIKIDDPLLRPAKAAEMLGVKVQTLAVWRYRKNQGLTAPDLPYVKIGLRAIRYRLSDVQRFIEVNRHADNEVTECQPADLVGNTGCQGEG